MKRVIAILLLSMFLSSSCAVNRTYINEYGEQMRIVKEYFPEIYDLYRQGDARIYEIYEYEKDGVEKSNILSFFDVGFVLIGGGWRKALM